MNYKMKEDVSKKVRSKFKNTYFEEVIGISGAYVSLILNRRRACSKRVAYYFTKAIDSESEIEDFFEVA